jgi:thiol reductant ABC exporter CydC subunit
VTSAARRLVALAELPRGRAAVSVALGALALGFAVALPSTAGYLISRAAEQPPILSLTTIIVVVRFLALARPLARYLERLSSHDLALRSLGPLRARVYRRLEPLAPAELDAFRRGDLVTRLVGDIDGLQNLYLRGLGPALASVVVGLACIVATALVLPVAALALAVGLVLGGVAVPILAARLVRRSSRRQAAARGELTAELVELLRGAPELVAYGREDDVLARVRAADGELLRLARRDALAAGLADAASVAVAGLTTAAVLAIAVAAHDAGTLDRVLVATLALLALSSFETVAPLSGAARELVGTLAGGRRVLELTGREPVVRDPVVPVPAPIGPVAVVLEDVTARYPAAPSPAVEHVDLRLGPGERVALVGPSGSGKTTVTNLLLRFLDAEAGTVALDGCDVRTLRQEDVRRTFALAGQDAHVFDSTIRENLRLARPRATDDELVAALTSARLADWVETLPDGLDTLVGEDGARLSGGQRQRLIVARALLAEAPVLLLDEPTAHLDPRTAEALVRDVLDAADGRSVLLITHRPEGLDLVDRVVTLGGTVPEPEGATGPADAC